MCLRVSYLVLLPTALLVIVEDVLSDVLPAVMVGGDMVNTLLQSFVAPPTGVKENAQQQHCETETETVVREGYFKG